MLTPLKFMECVNGFQKSAVVRTAVELEIFTHIARGRDCVDLVAEASGCAPKGVMVLLDALTILGLLEKHGEQYHLTPESALFLDKASPEYMADCVRFQHAPFMYAAFAEFTAAVRKGGTAAGDGGTVAPDHPVWRDFARAMAPMAIPAARKAAGLSGGVSKVLDIAAGHGMYGIAMLQKHDRAHCVAVDWPNVLPLAEENARIAGVGDRWEGRPGSVFEVDLGQDYDAVLLPNILHHFDREGCLAVLRRVHGAMNQAGRLFIVELMPNGDRVSPSAAAWFAVMMLASTPAGDAYTAEEYGAMLSETGFREVIREAVPGTARTILVAGLAEVR